MEKWLRPYQKGKMTFLTFVCPQCKPTLDNSLSQDAAA